MTEHQRRPRTGLTVPADQPLMGVIDQLNGAEVVRYFSYEPDPDEELGDQGVQQALSLAGAWRDIDSEDFLDELDRIRHQSTPTTPIELPELDDSAPSGVPASQQLTP